MKPAILIKVATLSIMMTGGLFQFLPARAWGAAEESFILANGLKVILVEQQGSPVVSMRIMVRTGSADELNSSEYGLAHLMEHMAFKGSTHYLEPGVISSLVERNGGDMNAYTSSDATVYYLNMPADQLALGLDILSELVFHPIYDPKEYELEKEVVIEEIKQGRDNPDRQLMETFFDAAYPGHPYGRPVIGFEETVRNVSVKEAWDFHQRHYRPDNATLVITGGFDRAKAKETINSLFDGLEKPQTQLQKMPDPPLAPASGPEIRVELSEKVALAKIFIGFRGPAGHDPEAPVMDLLSSILSGGKSSRLIEVIKEQKQLVTDISTGSYAPRYQGAFIISMETEPAKVLPAIEAVWLELEKLASEPPADDEMSRAKALAEKAFLTGQESSLGLASHITEFESMFGDWRLKDAYLPLWNRTGRLELAQNAVNYFKPENMTLVVMLPENNQDKNYPTEADLKKLARKLSPPALATKVKATPAFQEFRLESGLRLLVMRDASVPLVNVRAAAMGGLLSKSEAKDKAGLSNFMTSVWAKATEKKSVAELSRAIENIGASISAFSGRNSVGLTASFLASNIEEGFRLFSEILTAPVFSAEEVEKVRPEILAQIKAQDEQLSGRVMRLLAHNLYPGNHPYSRPQLGTAESISEISPNDLKNLYEELIRPEDIIIAVAGDVEPQKVKESLDAILADWKAKGQAQPAQIPPAPPAITKPIKITEDLNRAQTHIAFGFQAPGLGDPDGPALDVLSAYLSGMSGPLFRELRDQQSLAYTVQCAFNPGLGVGSFSFYMATDPKKVDDALRGFEDIIKRVREHDISQEELQGAKRYIIGAAKIRQQTVSSRAGQVILNSLYGLGLDYEEKRLADIEKVTAKDVKKVAAKYLQPEKGVLTILGKNQETPGESAKKTE